MVDYSNMEKFKKHERIVSRNEYIVPDFEKFHSELSSSATTAELYDIYTTRRPATYVNGSKVTFDLLFTYTPASPISPVDEAEVVSIVDNAIQANVTEKLADNFLYPNNYVMVINYIDMNLNSDGEIVDVDIRSNFEKVKDDPWPQP